MLATSPLSCSLISNKGIILLFSGVKSNTSTGAFHSWAPSFWHNLPLSLLSATSVVSSGNTSNHISLTWPFPINTSMLDGLLMLQNCFLNFAVIHWFDYHTTETGYTGNIGAIKIWLIYLLINWLIGWYLTVSIHTITTWGQTPRVEVKAFIQFHNCYVSGVFRLLPRMKCPECHWKWKVHCEKPTWIAWQQLPSCIQLECSHQHEPFYSFSPDSTDSNNFPHFTSLIESCRPEKPVTADLVHD